MLNYEQTSQFKKDIKKIRKRGWSLEPLEGVLQMIIDEKPLGYEYKNHKLSPKNLGNWECHINGRNSDWLLTYKLYPEKNLVVFTRCGTHSDLFK